MGLVPSLLLIRINCHKPLGQFPWIPAGSQLRFWEAHLLGGGGQSYRDPFLPLNIYFKENKKNYETKTGRYEKNFFILEMKNIVIEFRIQQPQKSLRWSQSERELVG